MKNLIKLVSLGLLVLGLANCGSKGGSSHAPSPKTASNAEQIDVTNNSTGAVITWSSVKNNIYYATSKNCIKGLSSHSDDTATVNSRFETLSALINSSSISKGNQANSSSDSIYLTIRYTNGKTRIFNLRNDLASTSEEVLSKGAEIIAFYDDVNVEIQKSGYASCNNGKK